MPAESTGEPVALRDADEEAGREDLRGYRAERREEEHTRKRKRWVLVTLVVILAAAAVLAVLEGDRVKDAAGWFSDKISSIWEEDQGDRDETGNLYLTNPVTGQGFQDEAVNTLVCVDNNQILSVLLISLNGNGSMKCYLIPEDIVGKSQAGNDLSLSQALTSSPERMTELRYMVESLTGQPVHYVTVFPLKKLLLLADGLEFPPIKMASDTDVFNLYNGNWEKLVAGQEIKDADRILSYLMALGDPEEYEQREQRTAAYLPELMPALATLTEEELAEALVIETGTFSLNPSTSGEQERADYLASLIAAWSEGFGEGCAYFSAPEIEILNGCGVVGAGNDMRTRLESRGFEVAESGKNAKIIADGQEVNDFSHQASVIRYNSSDPLAEAYARYIAMLYKIPQVEYAEGGRGITIIVGSDLASPTI